MNRILQTFLPILMLGFSVSLFAVNNTSTLDFDGVNDYVRYADDATLGRMDGASSYTIEAWVRLQPGANTGGRIVQRYSLFTLYYGTSNNRLSFGVDSGGSWHYYHSNNNTLPDDGNWHHVAAIRDAAAGTFRLYVDGVNVSSGSWSGYALNNETSKNLYIGNDGGSGNYFKGTIDEVRLKNVAVSPANLHSNSMDLPYTSDGNTAALFHFDENSGSTTNNEASGVNARLGDSTIGDVKEPSWSDIIGLPLPVKLLSLNVKNNNRVIVLQWETTNEINNRLFKIEKSADEENWEKIGQQTGLGANHQYNFIDKNPENGMNYYRLQQIDWDGTIQYSVIRSIRFSDTNSITLYPNPAVDFIQLKGIHPDWAQNATIVDQNGKVALTFKLTNEKVNIQSLPNGIYYLFVAGLDKFYPVQFIKH